MVRPVHLPRHRRDTDGNRTRQSELRGMHRRLSMYHHSSENDRGGGDLLSMPRGRRPLQQYIDEIEGIREVLPEDWKVVPVFIIAGTTSVNEVEWKAAKKAFGVPPKKWKAFREHLMCALPNELDKVPRSFWAQRLGSTQSSTPVASQATADSAFFFPFVSFFSFSF